MPKRLTRQQAINENCKQCLYDPYAAGLGTWKQQIEACTDEECPLYGYRPRSQGRKSGSTATLPTATPRKRVKRGQSTGAVKNKRKELGYG